MTATLAANGGLLRKFVRRMVRIYYPKIEIENAERVPQQGPVLLAANHPNSVLDAAMLGIAAGRPVHFLAKAPLFDVPVFGSLMRALGMLPVQRACDAPASEPTSNVDTLAQAAEYLVQGKAVGLFPEGKTHDAAHLEMVRSGAARIALQAVEAGARDLKLVPIAINYECKQRVRSAVWLRIGEPIPVREWLEGLGGKGNPSRALTAELGRRLKELSVHIEGAEWERFLPALELLAPPQPSPASSVAAVRQRKRIADAMNHFLSSDKPRAQACADALTAQQQRLAAAGLSLDSRVLRQHGGRMLVHMLGRLLWLTAFFPIAILGALHHLIPFALVRLIAGRIQTPGQTTVSLARLGLGLPVYALWYALVAWLMVRHEFQPWAICAWLIPMPLAGLVALHYWPYAWAAAKGWWAQFKLTVFQRGRLGDLRREQQELAARLRQLTEDYARVSPPPAPPAVQLPRRRASLQVGAAATACLVVGWLVLQMRQPPISELSVPARNLSALSKTDLASELSSDEKALADAINGLGDLERRALAVRDEFNSGKRTYYSQADNDAVRQLLLAFINYRAALFRQVWKYQSFQQAKDEALRQRAFLCSHTAAVVLHHYALKLLTQFDRPETIRKLNEAEPIWGIPADFYDTVRRNMMRSDTHQLIQGAFAEYHKRQDAFARAGLDREPYRAFHAAVADAERASSALAPTIWTEAALSAEKIERAGKAVHYSVQSLIATWIGDTKLRSPRSGQTLIRAEQLEKLKPLLKPGDILLERRNWFLSNAFLPGYWPHGAVYAGSADDLRALGLEKDPRVAKHWEAYSRAAEDGHAHVIVEAVSEGVIFSTLEHSIGGGDAVAVLRPRLTREQTNEALCRAFSHAGKPYDFEFDFFTTDKIVCTELVFRSYDGVVHFDLVDVLGRKTLPAIEIVRKFSTEHQRPERQLEFVAFVDGDEKKGCAEFCDVERFISTLQRPGMTWLQGLVPEK